MQDATPAPEEGCLMPFDLSEYVTVDERIQLFYKHHKDGRLQTREVKFCEWPQPGILAVAEAYRTPDDPHPGVGTAWEPVPGKTNFTKDSEVQNAETAAWGRAIVALGIGAKPGQLASREEVQARQPDVEESPVAPAAPPAAARLSVPAPAASATGDEHKRAHETKSTLDVADPDRTLISREQQKRLFTIARKNRSEGGYGLSDATIKTVVESLTGSPSTTKIQRHVYDQVMADLKMAGEAIPA
jgi:hypothetical protein